MPRERQWRQIKWSGQKLKVNAIIRKTYSGSRPGVNEVGGINS